MDIGELIAIVKPYTNVQLSKRAKVTVLPANVLETTKEYFVRLVKKSSSKIGENCVKCPQEWAIYLLITLVVILVCIIICLYCMVNVSHTGTTSMGIGMRMFIDFIQISSQISLFNVELPGILRTFFQIEESISAITGQGIHYLWGCAFTEYYQYFIMIVSFPIWTSILLLIVSIIRYFHLIRRGDHIIFKELYGANLFSMLTLLYISVVKQSVTTLVCDSFDSGPINQPQIHRYLHYDLSLSCDTPFYTLLYWTSLGILFAYSLGVPFIGCSLVQSYSGPVGYIKAGFRTNWKFWGIIGGLLRKAVTVLIVVVIQSGFLQSYLSCWVMAISSCISLFACPFENNSFNYVEGGVYGLLAVTMLSNLIYTHMDGILSEFYDTVTIGVVVISGITFSFLFKFIHDPISRSIKRFVSRHPKIMAFIPPFLQIKLKSKPLNVLIRSSLEKAISVFDREMLEWKDQVSENLVEVDRESAEKFEAVRREGLKELRNKLITFNPSLLKHRNALNHRNWEINEVKNNSNEQLKFPWKPIRKPRKIELDQCFVINDPFNDLWNNGSEIDINSVCYSTKISQVVDFNCPSLQISPFMDNEPTSPWDKYTSKERPPTPTMFEDFLFEFEKKPELKL
eukprot:NODE_549_length_2607_cov_52.041465_g472_i0.p1 GENE.NODE_549_length_2607_cov_52.041465_g472_i0~~NODE_549_length_2607_cov_52.041465_g472_i0.p1  ORF type:complete len:625 (+),score=64.04 NODE_549_length_2607_cov_52.041465_g472_i0:472-2346(+)